MDRQVSTGDEPYIVVSSDTHAGLQCEEYRPYLDSASTRSSTATWPSATSSAKSPRK